MNNSINTLADFFLSDAKTLSKDQRSSIETSKQIEELKKNLQKEAESLKWPPILDQVADKIADLLNITIKDIMVGAWNNYHYLDKYLDRSRYAPDETILVPLAEHTIKSKHHPCIEILVNDCVIDDIKLDITVAFKLKGIMLTIRDGKIRQIQTGTCKGSGTVKYEQMILAQKELSTISLPGKISLGDEGAAIA